MKKITVSIIMATYNRSHLLEDSLNSIRDQTFNDWECFIIDDGSTDDTQRLTNSIVISDKRFKYVKRSSFHKKGLAGCRNMGLELATGDFIIFFDDDDLVHPQNLEMSLAYLLGSEKDFCNYQKRPFLEQEPEMIRLKKIDRYKKFGVQELEKFVSGERAMASCTVLWSKKCFGNIRFNEDLHYAEEWECYGRILLAGFEGITIDEVLYFNRKHPGSNTGRFESDDPRAKESMSQAARLMIENIAEANKLTSGLEKYFVRLSFKLKDYRLIHRLFSYTQPNFFGRLKYWGGFQLYPILRPIFKIKAKI